MNTLISAVAAVAAFVLITLAARRVLAGDGGPVRFNDEADLAEANRRIAPPFAVFSEGTAASDAISVADARAIIRRLNAELFDGFFAERDVLAVIQIESDFRPRAERFEERLGESSFGLMQLLESSARDRGLTGSVRELFDPETNIRIGMAHLKWSWDFLSRRDPNISVDQWIGSYNAGVGNALKGFIPMDYVRKWRKARERFQ